MTDIVVLVVAADDGVMPQTIEAVMPAAEAPFIVVNKQARPTDTGEKRPVAYEIVSKMGGDTQIVMSAHAGLDNLLEAIGLAELMELVPCSAKAKAW